MNESVNYYSEKTGDSGEKFSSSSRRGETEPSFTGARGTDERIRANSGVRHSSSAHLRIEEGREEFGD